MEAIKTEKTAAGEIEMEVMEVQDLPEKFRPPPGGAPTTEDVPGPIGELIREATFELTDSEWEVFLRRLREEHPELFSRKNGEDSQQLSKEATGDFSEEEFSEEEWREKLTRLLKEEANRFMAAAVGL